MLFCRLLPAPYIKTPLANINTKGVFRYINSRCIKTTHICGQPDEGTYKNTYMVWTVFWAVAYVIGLILAVSTDGYRFGIIYFLLAVFALLASTNVRYFMRNRWNTPSDCCEGNNGCLSDCCCVY